MVAIENAVRAVLVPLLLATGGLLALLVIYVVLLHAARELHFRWQTRQQARYRPLVNAALYGDDRDDAVRLLQAAPRHHLAVVRALLLEPLRVAQGAVAERAAAVAAALGLDARWRRGLADTRWWVRAEAAWALGLVRARLAGPAIVALLDDPFEEVRAAAVEALGLIGDPAAIPELVTRLDQQSRHQRVRVVHALRAFGTAAVTPVLEHAQRTPAGRAALADLLAALEAPGALPTLVAWLSDSDPATRAAAAHAVGAIGVDDRAYYHLLRALSDSSAEVRGSAAWALGRSGRQDAAGHLARHLTDEWMVAAQSARALRDLGAAGRRALEAAARDHNVLAQQMLWDLGGAARAS